jgi:sortase A
MKKIRKGLLAYIYIPFIFTVLGYLLLYIAIAPALDMLQASWNMIVADEAPTYNQELSSIYNPTNVYKNTTIQNTLDNPHDQESLYNASLHISVDNLIAQNTLNHTTDNDSLSNTISIENIQFPNHGTHFANLSCARINLDAPIFWGDADDILKVGVGQYTGSFLPGFGRTILLSGHNTTYFNSLKLMEVGDVIEYSTNYGSYVYRVSNLQVLQVKEAKERLDDYLSYQDETLIIYTCYPFEILSGTKMERLFVFAEKISGNHVE